MNKQHQRWLTFAAALLLLCAWPALAADVSITILHTNDFHQSIEPLPRIAGYVAKYRQTHPNTLFLDAGDYFDRGSSLVPMTRGEAIYGAMGRMGYDAWIVGNHDWAYGGPRLIELMRQYPTPVLGTNLGTTKPPLPKNLVRTIVKEFDGVSVGLFGITLDTYGKNPKWRPHLYVLDCREQTAKAIAELKAAKVDIIVAVTHLGFAKMKHETRSGHPSDEDMAKAYPDIDVIIGGHSHTLLREKVTRELHKQTGVIVVQAGASARYVGRLTLNVDADTRAINSFEIEHVKTDAKLPEHPEVAAFLKQRYDQHMPNAAAMVGEIPERIEFHNLAYWYADFIREQAGADIVLMPRKTLYDEPRSFRKGKLTVERLFGYLYNRYLIKSTVTGAELLKRYDTDAWRDRFNPFHHRGRPFSGNAMFYSGMDVTFDAATKSVKFGLDPAKRYTLVTPWPFVHSDMRRYGHQLPGRDVPAKAQPVPGLKVEQPVVLPQTTHELLTAIGMSQGLKFAAKYPKPRADWAPWTEHFESKLKK